MTKYPKQRGTNARPAADGGTGRTGFPALLSREEEAELAMRSAAGDDDALDRLITSHRQFVIKIARKYRNYGLPMQDLVQEGMVGFIQAVRRFDPAHEARLSTYAMWWIRASIQDHVVRSWSLVRVGTTAAQKALFFRVRRMMADLKLGADAFTEEACQALAQRFGVPLKEVLATVRRASGLDQSLNRPATRGGGERAAESHESWLDQIADEAPNPEARVAAASERTFWQGLLERALGGLPPREAFIIRSRYLKDRVPTREALGRELGISKERVRQLEARAMAKLRSLLGPMRQGAGL
ncbi:MAG TPA: RNA polymerase factor sigma-32 [Alphaproteobacteria bacterium]|nr:RNA polymerase factor sigma-32 [Alphaproteobacteria bacterium]